LIAGIEHAMRTHLNTTRDIANIAVPLLGAGIMVYYGSCETTCATLSGSLFGIDLKIVGVSFMVVLFLFNLIALPELRRYIVHLRASMLAAALGGEALLVRFQIVHDTFCPYCLAFMACLVALFAFNTGRFTNWRIAGGCFVAGVAAFFLWFEGAVGPMLFLLD